MNETAAPLTLDALRTEITARYEALSKRLKQIARFALDHPNEMALETVATIAARAEVQPSALIRFAQSFGYSGFSDMQRVFQAHLLESAPSYQARFRAFREQDGAASPSTAERVLREFAAAGVVALEQMQRDPPVPALERAVALLAQARLIHVIGQRRSAPVAVYLAYALNRILRPARLIDGSGGMLFDQLGSLGPGDALIAISFTPYAPDTVEVAERAAAKGVPIVSLTDSPVSPIARLADVWFEIRDAEVHGFRSLTASLCLAQSLAVATGLHLEQSGG